MGFRNEYFNTPFSGISGMRQPNGMGIKVATDRDYDQLHKNCYKEQTIHEEPQPPRMRKFEIRLRYWTNIVQITHAVNYCETAYDKYHAEELAHEKYPQISDGTLEITEYYGD